MREVITQASILGAKETVTLEWVAIESVEATRAPGKESSIPARGLGIMPTVKIEPIEKDSEGEDEQKHERSEGEFGREQTTTPSRGPRPPEEADNRTEARIRAHEIDVLRKQLEEMKISIANQTLPSGFITSTRREQINGTRGTREKWVAEAIILDAANRVKQWKHPVTHVKETPAEYRRRMILNAAIKESLKKYPEFYKNELEGDNYTIVRNVIMFGEPSSKAMKVHLSSKLEQLVKTKEATYQEYEAELRELWDELACIGKIVSDEDKTLKLISGMEHDRRYKFVVKDVCNSDSSYAQCHSAFMQEAHTQKDLWREQKKKFNSQGDVNSTEQSGTSRTAGKARTRNAAKEEEEVEKMGTEKPMIRTRNRDRTRVPSFSHMVGADTVINVASRISHWTNFKPARRAMGRKRKEKTLKEIRAKTKTATTEIRSHASNFATKESVDTVTRADILTRTAQIP